VNGTGMLVWEVVFGSWVGWNERDKSLLRTMLDVQRRQAALLTHGAWTPLAARSDDAQVVGSRWERRGETLWALSNRRPEPFDGLVALDARSLRIELPPRGIAAVEPDGRVV